MRSNAPQLIFVAILCGCSATPIVEIPEQPELPAEWGNYALHMIVESECPDVQGTYKNLPKIITFNGSERSDSIGKDFDFFSLFPVYLGSESVKQSLAKPESRSFLKLEQPSPNLLVLTIEGEDRRDSVMYEFRREEGDFECVGGFVEFPVTSTYGTGEGTMLNGQEREKIALIEHGDLVVISSWGPYRLRKSNVSSMFTHEFYLYHRL